MASLPNAYEAPRRWGAAIGISSLTIFFSFVYFGDAERGKVATYAFVALASLAALKWQHRGAIWFWVFFFVAFTLHIIVIFGRAWPEERRPALATFGPYVVLDLVVMLLVVTGIAKLAKK